MSRQRSSEILAAGRDQHRAGQLLEAERLYRLACAVDDKNPEAFHLLAIVAHQLKRPDAMVLIEKAARLAPRAAQVHNDRGVILTSLGKIEDSLASFERAVRLNADHLEARNNLAQALIHLNRPDQAVEHLQVLREKAPLAPSPALSLAAVLRQLGRLDDAIACYRQVLSLHPNFRDAHVGLSITLQARGFLEESLSHAQSAVAVEPGSPALRSNVGNVLRAMGRLDEALEQFDTAIATAPQFAPAYYNRGMVLRGLSRLREAQQSFSRACEFQPDFLEAKLAACMAELPILYADETEITQSRERYKAALTDLASDIAISGSPAALADVIGSHQPFYLPYQGRNDRELQRDYGIIVSDVMNARYRVPTLKSTVATNRKIRVGIVSGFFRRHSNWKIPIKGWVSQIDRKRFHVAGYHTGSDQDEETDVAAKMCDRFIQGPLTVEQWMSAILDDALDVLIYPELGMDKTATQLAGLRLAPVQCCSWGHPVTSGLPAMDYFLSSDLMEPVEAQEHYAERLVRLANLSIYYEEPETTGPFTLERSELGLRSDAIVYWCCQSLPKYLPQYDDVFARIAKGVGNCQFTFIEFGGGQNITELFKTRLKNAFAAHGLNASNHCVFLPRLDAVAFPFAMSLADVFLDSIGWSGCNSTLESLEHNLPIVSIAGDFMRGRHTTAILSMMNLTDLISQTVNDYVDRAISLGLDAGWRAKISDRISANKHLVYRDRTSIASLEKFLALAVGA